MAKPKKAGGPKQKLSPEAKKAKAARDLKIAKSPERMEKKRDNYSKRKEAEKKFGSYGYWARTMTTRMVSLSL